MSSCNMVQDYTIEECLPEQYNRYGSEVTNLDTVVYLWRYALLVVHAKKKNFTFLSLNNEVSTMLDCTVNYV